MGKEVAMFTVQQCCAFWLHLQVVWWCLLSIHCCTSTRAFHHSEFPSTLKPPGPQPSHCVSLHLPRLCLSVRLHGVTHPSIIRPCLHRPGVQEEVKISLDCSQSSFIGHDKMVISLKGGEMWVWCLRAACNLPQPWCCVKNVFIRWMSPNKTRNLYNAANCCLYTILDVV